MGCLNLGGRRTRCYSVAEWNEWKSGKGDLVHFLVGQFGCCDLWGEREGGIWRLIKSWQAIFHGGVSLCTYRMPCVSLVYIRKQNCRVKRAIVQTRG